MKGCLDPFSRNYTANADEECDDCCTYPEVKVKMTYSLGDEGYRSTRLATNNINSFFVINAGFYLHQVEFQTKDASISVTEEIELVNQDGSKSRQKDDFVKISPSDGTNFSLGTHQSRDSIQSVRFTLGLPVDFNQLDSAEISEASELSQVNNVLYDKSKGYLSAYMDILYDTKALDTVRYQVPIGDLLQTKMLDTIFLLEYGDELSLNLNVDFLEWTKGINFANDGSDTALVKSIFVQNIPNSLSLD